MLGDLHRPRGALPGSLGHTVNRERQPAEGGAVGRYWTEWSRIGSAGRRQLHSEDSILDAARTVVLERGARATTIAAIATGSRAPKGSIYHLFGSQDDLLAAMWIRAVKRSQAAFTEALEDRDPLAASLAAALSLYDFAKRNPGDARLLASLRREDILQSAGSPELRRQRAELNRPLQAAVVRLARRLFGRTTRDNVERTACAVIDLPMGATRRHLIAGSPLPGPLRDQLEAAVRAALTHEGRRPNVREIPAHNDQRRRALRPGGSPDRSRFAHAR